MDRRSINKIMAGAFLASAYIAGPRAESIFGARPVRLVIPYPPGGSSDILGRTMAKSLAEHLDTNFIVENKPGGTTQIGSEYVARSKPDGNTLLLGSSTLFAILPLQRDIPVGIDDFEMIGGIASYVPVFAVNNSLPINSIKEFIEYAKEHEERGLTFGTAGEMSKGHILGKTIAYTTGTNLIHVPYRGSSAAVTGLLGGEIDFVIDGAVSPMIDAGSVRGLATVFPRRHPKLPDILTLSEAGLDIEMAVGSNWSILAPLGTSKLLVNKIANALQQILSEEQIKTFLANANALPDWQAADDYKEKLLKDAELYRKLLPVIGIDR